MMKMWIHHIVQRISTPESQYLSLPSSPSISLSLSLFFSCSMLACDIISHWCIEQAFQQRKEKNTLEYVAYLMVLPLFNGNVITSVCFHIFRYGKVGSRFGRKKADDKIWHTVTIICLTYYIYFVIFICMKMPTDKKRVNRIRLLYKYIYIYNVVMKLWNDDKNNISHTQNTHWTNEINTVWVQ